MKKLIFIIFTVIIIFSVSCIIVDRSTSNQNLVCIKAKEYELPAVKKPYIFYDILGKSDKLTSKQIDEMSVWRKDVVITAKLNNETVFVNGVTTEKEISLTFDDGPDNKIMPQILTVLKKNNINASFFLIGKNIKASSLVIKQAFDDGNLVLNHSYNHPVFDDKSQTFISSEFENTNKEIEKIIGKTPLIIRPPYGIVNDNVINVAKIHNYKLIIWSIDTLDWSKKDKYNISANVINNARPGDIILMHCDSDKVATLEALPIIISELKNKGYAFVTLDKLLNTKAYN